MRGCTGTREIQQNIFILPVILILIFWEIGLWGLVTIYLLQGIIFYNKSIPGGYKNLVFLSSFYHHDQ